MQRIYGILSFKSIILLKYNCGNHRLTYLGTVGTGQSEVGDVGDAADNRAVSGGEADGLNGCLLTD